MAAARERRGVVVVGYAWAATSCGGEGSLLNTPQLSRRVNIGMIQSRTAEASGLERDKPIPNTRSRRCQRSGCCGAKSNSNNVVCKRAAKSGVLSWLAGESGEAVLLQRNNWLMKVWT